MEAVRIKMGDGGRLVIPAEFRRRLGLESGAEVLVLVEDDEIRMSTPGVALRRARQIVRRHVPAGESLVDELIAQRRAAAAQGE